MDKVIVNWGGNSLTKASQPFTLKNGRTFETVAPLALNASTSLGGNINIIYGLVNNMLISDEENDYVNYFDG